MEWLLQLGPEDALEGHLLLPALQSAAEGCDLVTLQRLAGRQQDTWQLDSWHNTFVLAAAAGSPTPDWQAKVEWLEAQGVPRAAPAYHRAVACPDALDRMRWLRDRGYPLHKKVVLWAARAGSRDALAFLLSEGMAPEEYSIRGVAGGGHLAALQLLRDHGCPMDEATVASAARAGHLHVVVWLVEALGDELLQEKSVCTAAMESGNLELLRWLRERGWPWGTDAFTQAAAAGCEEVLEWLVEQGCPMEENGWPYEVAASNGDMATLRCLRRLGCPWGPHGWLFAKCVARCCRLPVLSW
ncbi:hypothetical protein Agub_g6835, partial [Astrephomene gubernaculifera]